VRTPWGWSDPRTVEDEVSHPQRYTPEFIEAERGPEAYGLAGFEGQYNQNPETTEGGWFKRACWSFWRLAGSLDLLGPRPEGCRPRTGEGAVPAVEIKLTPRGHIDLEWVDLNVDASFGSLSDDASAVSLTLIGGRGGQRFILFDSTQPRTYTETEDAIREIVHTWKLGHIDKLVIEDKAQGTAIMDRLRKAMSGVDPSIPPLLGPDGKPLVLAVEMRSPEGGKAARARAILPTQEAGLIHVLDGADWAPAWVHEVSSFPHGKRNDRVDTLSQGLTFRAGHSVAKATTRREIDAMLKFAGR
jgi:phage terminase large subunit-like protein